MLKEARNRLQPIVIRYCITIGCLSVSYLRAKALDIAHAADNKAPSRFGVLRCLSTLDRLAEPKSTPRLVASPSADLVRTEPKADRTCCRLAVQYVAVSFSPMTAKIETVESNWLFALPVDGLTLNRPIAFAAARSAASGLEVAVLAIESGEMVLIGQA